MMLQLQMLKYSCLRSLIQESIGHHANDGTAEVTVQSRDQRGFKNHPFKDHVVFAARLIEIRIALLVLRLYGGDRWLRCLR